MIVKYKNVSGYLLHFETVNGGVDMASVILLDAETNIKYSFRCFTKDLEVVKDEENI